MKRIGYMVIDHAEEWEQPLGLKVGKDLPTGGILNWTDGARAVFRNRADARKAIDRTEHYRLAFGRTDLPEKKFCKVVPLASADLFETSRQ